MVRSVPSPASQAEEGEGKRGSARPLCLMPRPPGGQEVCTVARDPVSSRMCPHLTHPLGSGVGPRVREGELFVVCVLVHRRRKQGGEGGGCPRFNWKASLK